MYYDFELFIYRDKITVSRQDYDQKSLIYRFVSYIVSLRFTISKKILLCHMRLNRDKKYFTILNNQSQGQKHEELKGTKIAFIKYLSQVLLSCDTQFNLKKAKTLPSITNHFDEILFPKPCAKSFIMNFLQNVFIVCSHTNLNHDRNILL